LSVRDTGVGIPPEMVPRVFDMFTQVDRSLERSQGGLGIGLTLVRSLVELHGGAIQAFSDGPGKGSEFVVRLPAAEPKAEPCAKGEPDRRAAQRGTARRVLVVDDNVDAAETLAMFLKLQGHEVRVLHDGAAVPGEARAFRPEVAVLDIGLPGLDGYEVARRLKADNEVADVVLVALTGFGGDDE